MSSQGELLDAALAALAEEGPDFRAESAAARAGASKALYFHHFGSREGLLDAMAARVLSLTQDGLDRLVQEHPNPRDRIDALVDVLFEEPVDGSRAESLRVVRFWLGGEPTPRWALRDALLRDFVEKTLRERHVRGAEEIATLVLSRWHGATLAFATGGAVDLAAEGRRVRAELERLL